MNPEICFVGYQATLVGPYILPHIDLAIVNGNAFFGEAITG